MKKMLNPMFVLNLFILAMVIILLSIVFKAIVLSSNGKNYQQAVERTGR